MKLIRHGVTRDVLLIGRWAIKVPKVRYGLHSIAHGILANQSEADWTEGEHLAPVQTVTLGSTT